MKSKAVLNVDELEHIPEISHYNNNVYKLPFELESCTHLFVKYGGDEELHSMWIGIITDNKFETKLWLNTYDDENIIIDSECLSVKYCYY
jgi:uncharacterized protein YneR